MSNNDSLKWDEERCKDGLAHLENLQNQVCFIVHLIFRRA